MIADTATLAPHNGYHLNKPAREPERETLRILLDRLRSIVADPEQLIDADKDRDFVYFDFMIHPDFDDIDICFHEGHVLVRMVREN